MDSPGAGAWLLGGVAVVVCAVALVCGIAWLFAFDSVSPDKVCIVQEGGPLDGRNVKEVRQPSSGVKNIGIWNSQKCYPATERHYTLVRNDEDGSNADAKVEFKTPTLDAQQAYVEGQARFVLNTDPEVIKDFYKRYGVRTFSGKKPNDGDEGWNNFLAQVFQPILFAALRETVGEFRCVELNNTCQYALEAERATRGNVKIIATSQNLDKIADEVAVKLQERLDSTLGGHYFENIRFSITRVSFEPEVETAITEAQTKRTEVATARLEAQRAVAEARGQNKALRIKARGYRVNPAQAKIDQIEKFCGPEGCSQIQVLGGGGISTILNTSP